MFDFFCVYSVYNNKYTQYNNVKIYTSKTWKRKDVPTLEETLETSPNS